MDVQETITNVQDKIIWNRDKGCEEKQIMIRDKDARQLPLIEEHLM